MLLAFQRDGPIPDARIFELAEQAGWRRALQSCATAENSGPPDQRSTAPTQLTQLNGSGLIFPAVTIMPDFRHAP